MNVLIAESYIEDLHTLQEKKADFDEEYDHFVRKWQHYMRSDDEDRGYSFSEAGREERDLAEALDYQSEVMASHAAASPFPAIMEEEDEDISALGFIDYSVGCPGGGCDALV